MRKSFSKLLINFKLPINKIFFLILFGLLESACSPSTTENSPRLNESFPPSKGGTMISAMSADPSGLIYMVAGESASASITSNIFNTLLKYNQQLDLAGELAESWQVSSDQKTITFHLKPNLKWADGHPLTSEDILFTWQLVTDPKTNSPYASDYQLVQKAEAPNPLIFTVHYAQPYAPALDSWSGLQVLPKHLLQGQDIHTTAFGQKTCW